MAAVSTQAPVAPAAVRPAAPAATNSRPDVWTWEEDKALENALAHHWASPDRLTRAAAAVPAKSLEAVTARFRALEMDVNNIEQSRIRCPPYAHSAEPSQPRLAVPQVAKAAAKRGGGAAGEERRKGVPWTEEEHRLFVAGLEEFGKGDWRSISRNYVLTRTPTQVASHAQKYFIRMNSGKKNDKRRSSIHDITSPAAPGAAVLRPPSGLNPAVSQSTAAAAAVTASHAAPMPQPPAVTAAAVTAPLQSQAPAPRPVAAPASAAPAVAAAAAAAATAMATATATQPPAVTQPPAAPVAAPK